MDKWLQDDVGIGGSAQRGFDATALIEFAWRLQMEDAEPDEIYAAFVEDQQESMKRKLASELGLEALGLEQLAQTAAMELESVCVKCGWLAVEQGSMLRKGFVERWFLLWTSEWKSSLVNSHVVSVAAPT